MTHARDPDLSRLLVAAEQRAELDLALRKKSFHVLLREHAIVHLHASVPRKKRRAATAGQQAAWRVRQVQLQRGRAAEEEEERRNRPCRRRRHEILGITTAVLAGLSEDQGTTRTCDPTVFLHRCK